MAKMPVGDRFWALFLGLGWLFCAVAPWIGFRDACTEAYVLRGGASAIAGLLGLGACIVAIIGEK